MSARCKNLILLFFYSVWKIIQRHLEVTGSGYSAQKSTECAENAQIEQKRAEARMRMALFLRDEGEIDLASSSGYSSHTFQLVYKISQNNSESLTDRKLNENLKHDSGVVTEENLNKKWTSR